jgi:hypothetical protein
LNPTEARAVSVWVNRRGGGGKSNSAALNLAPRRWWLAIGRKGEKREKIPHTARGFYAQASATGVSELQRPSRNRGENPGLRGGGIGLSTTTTTEGGGVPDQVVPHASGSENQGTWETWLPSGSRASVK